MDTLQRYCLALDIGNFDEIGAIWEKIHQDRDTGLEAAIMGLHSRFDSNESFTAQLAAVRNQYANLKGNNDHGM